MPLAASELVEFLRLCGIRSGDVVVFEAPGDSPERVAEGMSGLASALLQLIAPGGTLVVPTCTANEGSPKPVYDPALSPSEAGPFSEFFRRQPGVVRSHSPTHSVAASGPLATTVTEGHRSARGRLTPWGEEAFGVGSPWDWLAQCDAWWVFAGADWDSSPFTCYVRALYATEHLGITKETPFPRFRGEALLRTLLHEGIACRGKWGDEVVVVLRLRAAVDAALQALRHDPASLEPDGEMRRWVAQVADIRRLGYLQAGAARTAITPPTPCTRWDGKTLTGVYRDLYVRALVLSRGGPRVALVVCDLLGVSHKLVGRMRQAAHAATGIPPESILIAATHSHSTPDTVGSGYEDPEYLETLVAKVAKAIETAAARCEPARLGWLRVPIRGLARSRRVSLRGGGVYTMRYGVPSTWHVRPELIAGYGEIDRELTIVRIENLSCDVVALLSNLGCHASVALASPDLSGDFPGESMWALEQALGGSAVALHTNGSGGDVDPTLEMPYWGPRNDASARRLGRIFAGQVLEALERVEVGDDATVGAGLVPIDLPVRSDWAQLLENERERMVQEFVDGAALSDVIAEALRQRSIHTEVQALRLTDLVLVGLPGEVLTETGRKLKDALQGYQAAVVELANDCIGYIPTARAFAEGGYEVSRHLWGRVGPEAETALLIAAQRAVAALYRPNALRPGGNTASAG